MIRTHVFSSPGKLFQSKWSTASASYLALLHPSCARDASALLRLRFRHRLRSAGRSLIERRRRADFGCLMRILILRSTVMSRGAVLSFLVRCILSIDRIRPGASFLCGRDLRGVQ